MTAIATKLETAAAAPALYLVPGLRAEQPELSPFQQMQQRRQSYEQCVGELESFAIEHAVVPTTAQGAEMGAVVGHMIAKNWLRNTPESHEDSRAIASVLLSLFASVEPARLPDAVRRFESLRAGFGEHNAPGGHDTTHSFLARVQGRSLITRIDVGGLGERLTDDQLIGLQGLHQAYLHR